MRELFESKLVLMLVCGVLGSAFGCSDDAASKDADAGVDAGGKPEPSAECPVIVSDDDCDESKRPIVYIHGTYASGDNISYIAMLFGSNGYCQDRFLAVEYNSIGSNPLADMDVAIDAILEKTGFDQVDLMGHSQGTRHCTTYLADPEHAKKVAHYINLSGTSMIPNEVATLSISSDNDLGETAQHPANASEEVTFKDEDHYTLAASAKTFSEIWEYLYEEEPKYTEVQCGDEQVTIEGLAEEFGTNTPVTTGKIEVYELGDDPVKRGKPVLTLATNDPKGRIAPAKIDRLKMYEFKALDGDDKLVGYAYFPPLKRSNRLMRFLAPPTSPIVRFTTTANVTVGAGHSAIVVRPLAGALRFDLGDRFKINGVEVLSDAVAGRTTTTGGLFLADDNENQATELGKTFEAPFVFGTDVYIDASTVEWIDIDWNGQEFRIPSWPSSEGMISLAIE
jgi:alpha/beta hydrolase fold